jgi:hypothetical protein
MGRNPKLALSARPTGSRPSPLADARMYARFAWGLPRFLRRRITLQEAEQTVRQRLKQREENFLRLLERGVYGYPRSPYLPLLRLAGCELGDLRHMLRTRAIEGTLHTLREAGVYVRFEEFKGREPIVRSGRVLEVRASDFDNPYLSPAYYTQSGGTSGAGTRVPTDLDHQAAMAPHLILADAAHGVLGAPMAIWRGILPDGSGIMHLLQGALMGNVPRKWFTPITSQELRPALKYQLATYSAVLLGRAAGVPLPWPEPLPLDRAAVVAHWVADTLRVEGSCLLRTAVSRAVRVSIAAREEGLDLRGASFWGGGEPPTPAKVREITACGARWIPNYPFAEAGRVGIGCARPLDGNDVHFFKDSLALIQHARQVPGMDLTVPAFHFTSLLPTAPKLLLNAESDDYGVVEARSCGCPLEAYGYTEHIREVRSFRKLTGEGVSLVGSEMVRILEEVLPARFGGSPLDYQLLEEEDERGLTRLTLLVSPTIPLPDDTKVVGTVLAELGRGGAAADVARAIWCQARTLRVRRQEPIWTARGKLMPLHLAERAAGAAAAGKLASIGHAESGGDE